MLSPGDRILVDGNENIAENWVVEEAFRTVHGNYYKLAGWPEPTELVHHSRITKHVTYA